MHPLPIIAVVFAILSLLMLLLAVRDDIASADSGSNTVRTRTRIGIIFALVSAGLLVLWAWTR